MANLEWAAVAQSFQPLRALDIKTMDTLDRAAKSGLAGSKSKIL